MLSFSSRSQRYVNILKPLGYKEHPLIIPQGYQLALQPQSGRALAPRRQNGITQTIRLQGVERGQGQHVKMRWRAGYVLGGTGGQVQNEQGEIAGLGVL